MGGGKSPNPFDFSDLDKITRGVDGAKLGRAILNFGRTWKANRTYNDLVESYGPQVAEAAAEAARQGRRIDGILAQAEQQMEARRQRERILADPPPVHGSARWLKPSEMGTALRPREEVHNPRSLMLGSVADAAGNVLGGLHWDDEGHLLTLAPSRAGKSWTTIIPNLLRYRGAVIVHDPKGELYEHTSAWRATLGPVYRVNPYNAGTHPEKDRFPQHGFNPVASIRSYGDAQALARQMFPQDPRAPAFFIEDAVAFIAPLLWYIRQYLPPAAANLYSVSRFMADPIQLRDKLLPDLMATGLPELRDAATSLSVKFGRSGKGQAADIAELPTGLQTFFATLTTKLEFWRNPELAACISRDDVDFRALKQGSGIEGQTVTVYVTLPFRLLETSAPFLKMTFGHALNAMDEGPRPPIPVLFLMDEFLALGPAPEFARAMREIGGYGVRLWFFLQEIGALQEHYPGTSWQAFFNTSAKQFFGINDGFTSELISRQLSTGTVAMRNTNESGNVSASLGRDSGSAGLNYSAGESVSLHSRPLLMPNEVTEKLAAWLPNGTRRGIVQLGTLHQQPVEVLLATYKQSELLNSRVGPFTTDRGGYPS